MLDSIITASYHTWIVNINCTVLFVDKFLDTNHQDVFLDWKTGKKWRWERGWESLSNFTRILQTCQKLMIFRSLAESVAPKTVGLVRRIDESDAAVVDFEGTGGGVVAGDRINLTSGLGLRILNPTSQLASLEKLWMKQGEQMEGVQGEGLETDDFGEICMALELEHQHGATATAPQESHAKKWDVCRVESCWLVTSWSRVASLGNMWVHHAEYMSGPLSSTNATYIVHHSPIMDHEVLRYDFESWGELPRSFHGVLWCVVVTETRISKVWGKCLNPTRPAPAADRWLRLPGKSFEELELLPFVSVLEDSRSVGPRKVSQHNSFFFAWCTVGERSKKMFLYVFYMFLCISHGFSVWLPPKIPHGPIWLPPSGTEWTAWDARSLVRCPKKEPSMLGGARQGFRFWLGSTQSSDWLVVWLPCFIFPYIGNNHPNWLSYFSEGLKPPTRWAMFKSQVG